MLPADFIGEVWAETWKLKLIVKNKAKNILRIKFIFCNASFIDGK